jgi:tetratricopeptide (TPR) repeat protein
LNVALISGLILSAVNSQFAQKILPEKNPLVRLEKNIDAGKIDESEREVFAYAIANPQDAKGFSLFAKLRLKQNRLTEAKSLANKALLLDSKLVSAKITLALINFQSGQNEEARLMLNGISEAEIQDNSIRLVVSKTFVLIGDCEKALEFADKLPLKLKNTEALPLRAECFLQNDDRQNLAAMIPLAKSAAKLNPETGLKFAKVLLGGAMYKESSELLRGIVAANPKNTDALLLLAKTEIYLKDFSGAKIHLSQAEKLQPNSPDLIFVKSLFENEQGNTTQAFELLEKSLTLNPKNVEILSSYAFTAIRANKAGKAFRAAETLLNMQPENPDFIYLYGASALQSNKLKEAENSLTKFLEMRPKDSRGCIALGLTFAAQPDKLDIARSQMQNCLTVNPNNYEAAYQLGLSYKTQGEFQKATEFLEQTVQLSPGYAAALRDLGAVYLQSNNEAKARPVLEKSAAINPNDADTHFQLSRLYNLIGERELAKKHLDIFQKLKNPKKEGM